MTRSKTEHPVVATWRTSCQVTAFLVESLPDPLWSEVIPGAPRRTVRMILGHIHNSRCMWLKALGPRFEVAVPASVDRHKVTRRQLLPALKKSADAVALLLARSLEQDGRLTGFSPPDATHFMAYLVAHEGHHRGQIVLVARQTGHRLPGAVTAGLWQWARRKREAGEG